MLKKSKFSTFCAFLNYKVIKSQFLTYIYNIYLYICVLITFVLRQYPKMQNFGLIPVHLVDYCGSSDLSFIHGLSILPGMEIGFLLFWLNFLFKLRNLNNNLDVVFDVSGNMCHKDCKTFVFGENNGLACEPCLVDKRFFKKYTLIPAIFTKHIKCVNII